ncbi:MAG: hypothetical protein Q8N05_19675, partial [Bacteroidota bacterium]|nr:hypothetical protein [Bacteroidota bacterium]
MSYQLREVTVILLFGAGFLMLLVSCQPTGIKSFDLAEAERLFLSGELKKAELLADSVKSAGSIGEDGLHKLDSIVETGRRIRIDFCLTESVIKEKLRKYYPGLDTSLLRNWEKNLKLEIRQIDGEKRY